MSRLYELTGAYAEIAERVADGDELSSGKLAELHDAIEVKAAAMVRILRELDLDIDKVDDELQRLAARKKAAVANRERLRSYVRDCMEQAGVTKLRAGTFSMSVCDCPERVVVLDEDKVPEAYTRVRREVDKAAILRAYKDDGEVVPGTAIERGRRLVVR